MEKLFLFTLGSTYQFAEKIASRLHVPLCAHEERDFIDGEHKSRPLINVRDRSVFIMQSLYSDNNMSVNDKLCRLLFFIGALRDAAAKRIIAVVPYLCYARKDRKTKARDPVTTRYLACLFEAVGTDHVVTVDVHNLQAFQNAFRCCTDHLEAKKLFVDYLLPIIGSEEVAVMSPDVGGIKRAELLRLALAQKSGKTISSIFMEKSRSRDLLGGTTIAGDPDGKMVIIVDDLISSGITLVRAAEACKKSGAKYVYAIVTHGLFSGAAPQVLQNPALDKIIITNTIMTPVCIQEKITGKLEIIDISPLFAEAIHRIQTGGSIVALLNQQEN